MGPDHSQPPIVHGQVQEVKVPNRTAITHPAGPGRFVRARFGTLVPPPSPNGPDAGPPGPAESLVDAFRTSRSVRTRERVIVARSRVAR
jgi:hypothetical protein